MPLSCAEKKRRQRVKRHEWLRAIKESTPCARCGQLHPHWRMHYHHLDQATKSFDISHNGHGKDATLREMEKCELLCRNCHADAEWERGTFHA